MKIVILSGWASVKRFYTELFPFAIHFGLDNIESEEEIAIIAWSMGTLEAFSVIDRYNIKKLILVSPTMDFMSTMPLRVVKKMEEDLELNKERVLKDFIISNFKDSNIAMEYIDEYGQDIYKLDTDFLKKGLEYLRTTKVEINSFDIETLVFLGSYDRIIPRKNSLKALESFKNYKLIQFESGHNLLYKNDEFIKIVRSFLIDK